MIFSLPVPATFSTAFSISHGERNWPFLMFTTRPERPGGDQQIRLARKERGNLQHVADFRRRADLRNVVHIGQNGQAGVLLDRRENAQALGQARDRDRRRPRSDWPCRRRP